MSSRAKAADGSSLVVDPALVRFAAASEALCERRRGQRGVFTYGDAFDDALVAALAQVPPGEAGAARVAEAAERIGRTVYARRVFEDSFPGAFVVLSASLLASRIGSLEVVDLFHRTARVKARLLPPLRTTGDDAVAAYLRGVAAGFMGEAFNCVASVRTVEGDEFEVRLGEGRNPNGGRRG